jgi:hypothetical protein
MTKQTQSIKLPILSSLCGPCVLGGKKTKLSTAKSDGALAKADEPNVGQASLLDVKYETNPT